MAAKLLNDLAHLRRILEARDQGRHRAVFMGKKMPDVCIVHTTIPRRSGANTVNVEGLGRCEIISADHANGRMHVLVKTHVLRRYVMRQTTGGSEVE